MSSCQVWSTKDPAPVFEVEGGAQGEHPRPLPALVLRESLQGILGEAPSASCGTLLFLHIDIHICTV